MEICSQTNEYGRKQITSHLPFHSDIVPVLPGELSSASLGKTRCWIRSVWWPVQNNIFCIQQIIEI